MFIRKKKLIERLRELSNEYIKSAHYHQLDYEKNKDIEHREEMLMRAGAGNFASDLAAELKGKGKINVD